MKGINISKGNWREKTDRLLSVVASPFLRTPGLFIFLLILSISAFDYCYLSGILQNPIDGVAVTLLSNFAICLIEIWAMLLIYNLLLKWNRVVAMIWLIVPFAICIMSWLIDIGIAVVYQQSFNVDLCDIILSTNLDETSDFLSAYLGAKIFLLILCTLALAGIAAWLFSHFGKSWRRRIVALPMKKRILVKGIFPILLFLGIVGKAIIAPGNSYGPTPIGKLQTFYETEFVSESPEPQNPHVARKNYSQPQKIVVIIGESHNRNHSSLYGYHLPTQPRLERLRADSLLYVVQKPVSPELRTLESFRYFIGTYGCESSDPALPWYKNLTFLELARKSGYRVSWISNQPSSGLYDNPIKNVSEIANRDLYIRDVMDSNGVKDDALLPFVSRWIDHEQDLTVVHLIGSHFDYEKRYPAGWKPFNEANYSEFPEHQRFTRSAYDTSIHYNDYVVSEIMRLYEDQDAIVIYFSDHGQDVYDADSDYAGHGRKNNPASYKVGTEIPMYIYMSKTFKRLHPRQLQIVEQLTASPDEYNTNNFIYLLADLMGVEFTLPSK